MNTAKHYFLARYSSLNPQASLNRIGYLRSSKLSHVLSATIPRGYRRRWHQIDGYSHTSSRIKPKVSMAETVYGYQITLITSLKLQKDS